MSLADLKKFGIISRKPVHAEPPGQRRPRRGGKTGGRTRKVHTLSDGTAGTLQELAAMVEGATPTEGAIRDRLKKSNDPAVVLAPAKHQ